MRKTLSESFVDPFQLNDVTIDITLEEFTDEEDDDDSDYEPSFDITIRPEVFDFENMPIETDGGLDEDNEDIEDEDIESEDEEDMDIPEDVCEGVNRIRSDEHVNRLLDDGVYLVFMKQIVALAKTNVANICSTKDCKAVVQLITESVGSAVYLKWVCLSGHICHMWCSQPVLNRRLHSGDLLTSAAILMSGNNYGKIALFANMLNLKVVSASTFHRIQKHYLIPCIDEYWLQHQEDILSKYKDKSIVVLGDGRMDSPGFCAQYCSYTCMENESKDILSIVTMDKRETDRKSTNLEKACFEKSITELRGKGASIGEVVTDAHMQIGSLMKKNYQDIVHSLDIWHAAKNLGKKIIKAGQNKECKPLLKWSRHIVNHFWYCCKKATTYEEFLGIWLGVLHHVVNEHQWLFAHGGGENSCDHGPLSNDGRETEWLQKGSVAHDALRKIVYDKRFFSKVKNYLNFRSTAELETFQQHILMYAAKRYAFSPPVYRVRNRLAAIDHNIHNSREAKMNKSEEIINQRRYNKNSHRWSVCPVKTTKTYPHIRQLKQSILQKRLVDRQGMQRKKELEPQDPRRLSAHLAPTSPQPTAALVQEQVSRRS
ncbi:uncharacterized protein LOC144433886 [Glandiceps talaboti]